LGTHALASANTLWQPSLVGVISPLTCEAVVHGPACSLPSLFADERQPFDFFALSGLRWIDWATIAGLVLTVVGFGITWWQLYRTRTARQAVDDTRSEINQKIASEGLSESLPMLQEIYLKARSAASKRDRRQLRRRLENWSNKCSEAITQLQQLQERQPKHRRTRQNDDRVADAVKQLQSARNKVREGLRKMDDQPDMEDLELGLQYALNAMSHFSDLAAEMVEGMHYTSRRKAS
jgi:hypothetical protein